jgi:hypothetical protein
MSSEPSKKRARVDAATLNDADAAKQQRLRECIDEANELIGANAWFVCYGCNRLKVGPGNHLAISKWAYERVFCSKCVRHCAHCSEYYSEFMEYQHEDCPKPGKSDAVDLAAVRPVCLY